MIELVLHFLPLAGAAVILLLAQTQVRERSEKASLALSVGAGLEAAFLLALIWRYDASTKKGGTP